LILRSLQVVDSRAIKSPDLIIVGPHTRVAIPLIGLLSNSGSETVADVLGHKSRVQKWAESPAPRHGYHYAAADMDDFVRRFDRQVATTWSVLGVR
jgi:hypothetical protein